jgi:predicted phage terminase large subunit-like protein
MKQIDIPYRVYRWTLEEVREYKKNIKTRIQEIEKLPVEAQEKSIESLKASIRTNLENPRQIVLFAYLLLPESFSHEFNEYHFKFLDFLQAGIRGKKHKGGKCPRGFGKSTIVTKLGAIYEICNQTHNYILINSYDESMSIDKLRLIKEEFENNQAIKWLYGEPISDRDEWQKLSIICFGKVRVQTISTNQNPRGKLWRNTRPSKVISDDILKDEEVKNAEARERTKNWYVKQLLPCLTADGSIDFINTPMHPEDLIEDVFKKEGMFDPAKWDSLHLKAMVHNKSIDENWRTTEDLIFIKENDPVTFAQEYQGTPTIQQGTMVKEEWLRYWISETNVDEFTPKEVKIGHPIIEEGYIHIDTTRTGTKRSDYVAAGYMGKGSDKLLYLLDFILEKMDVETQARAVIKMYIWCIENHYPVNKITFDEKANEGFGYWIKKLAREEYDLSLPIQPLKYSKDKETHFRAHIPHFIANRVYFPYNHSKLPRAKEQLLAFPQKGINDDFVDFLAGVLDNLKLTDKRKKDTENAFKIRMI